MKIADKRAANKEAHAARERKAKNPEAAGSPTVRVVTPSVPTNVVKGVDVERTTDQQEENLGIEPRQVPTPVPPD